MGYLHTLCTNFDKTQASICTKKITIRKQRNNWEQNYDTKVVKKTI